MSIEAMKQALEALEDTESYWVQEVCENTPAKIEQSITSLRAAIEQERAALGLRREKQEPLAWVCEGFGKAKRTIDYIQKEIDALPIGTMLYTAQPQHEWQGLTEKERLTIENECETMVGKPAFDAIEAKLKEKNTCK
jgi:hypothetical protein